MNPLRVCEGLLLHLSHIPTTRVLRGRHGKSPEKSPENSRDVVEKLLPAVEMLPPGPTARNSACAASDMLTAIRKIVDVFEKKLSWSKVMSSTSCLRSTNTFTASPVGQGRCHDNSVPCSSTTGLDSKGSVVVENSMLVSQQYGRKHWRCRHHLLF
jgi:hypothetical protein